MAKQFNNNIKILFVCHGSILKSPEKASKINSFTADKGVYYTTTTPFLKESWCDTTLWKNNRKLYNSNIFCEEYAIQFEET